MLTKKDVDARYFTDWLNRVKGGIYHYTPPELARELVRMAFAADATEAHKEADTLRFARKTREGY